MTDTDPAAQDTPLSKRPGERLRELREAQGLSLAEIAARTRIPLRQLEAVETSNYAALPSVTYAVGFARAYARALGADEVEIAREVRAQNDHEVRRTEYEVYEVHDPSRIPGKGVALAAAFVAVLLLIGVGLWYGTGLFRRGEAAPATAPVAENAAAVVPVARPTPAGPGQVTLAAADDVWLRVYDADGKKLFENTMKKGDRFDVPADAKDPMINVGRPDKLQVLLNGSAVAPLGDGHRALKDVRVGAVALAARQAGMPVPTASASPAAVSRSGNDAGVPPAFAESNVAASAP